MNKRRLPRFPVTLDVTVTFAGTHERVCTVRDYCAGGMYLICASSAPVTRDDVVEVRFSSPLDAASELYRLKGKVARVAGSGMGIAFSESNPAALDALSQLSESQTSGGMVREAQTERLQLGEEKTTELIGECRKRTLEHLQSTLQKFFSLVNDALFVRAGEARSNTEQSAYFGAMNELRRKQGSIEQQFGSLLDEQFAVLTEEGYRSPFSQQGSSQGELSLVDNDVLDKWLSVRAMATKLESHLEGPLEALEMRLAAISNNPLSLENDPVGPFVIASAFRQALDSLVLEEAAENTIFLTMEGLLQQRLVALYDELNSLLVARGILPTISKKLEVVTPQGTPIGGSAGAPAARAEQVAEPVTMASAVAPASAPAVAATSQPPSRPAEPPPSLSYARPAGVVASAENGSYRGVQELLRLQQVQTDDSNAERPVAGYYSGTEVMQALAQLEQAGDELGEPMAALNRQLDQLGGESGRVLSDEDRQKMGYVGGMVHSILQDQLLAEFAKPWFSNLQVPLLKAGMLDPGIMTDAEHPARLLLNNLERIGDRLPQDDPAQAAQMRQRIEAIIQRVEDRVEEDADVFVDALGELEKLEKDVREDYEANVAKLVRELEKDSQVGQARRAVTTELNLRLAQRKVPELLLSLLDCGWKNLLLRSYMKEGAKSASFKNYLNIIDQLNAVLMQTQPYSTETRMSAAQLQEWLQRLLPMACREHEASEELLLSLVSHLRGEAEQPLATRYIPELVSLMDKRAHNPELVRPGDVDDEIWELMLLDAQELKVGESFSYRDEQGEQQLNLVWLDPQEPRFVFVDLAGHKRLDLSADEAAGALYRQRLSRTGEKSLSVTERATYRLLQQLHGKLAYQAQHDELTGLLNRKSFERELEETFVEARSGKATHVLGYIDLDRFNIINTTCGHSEGDILLGRVAQVLQQTVGEHAVLARLGGDEFGILLKGCSRTRGLKLITEVHDAIRDMRFVCEDNEFKITASIGLAEINEASDSSGRLLSAVDAATFTAKDMGRDNIQIYNAENERISNRRNILDWVGRINVLFEKNLIQLRCQKIKPVHSTVNSLPHYEVLLDVKDEEGNKVLLEEFIVAAERYNRIIDIDTWVVDYVLKWMEERSSKLDRISGISINLSGSSLGNRKFMEHVEQSLSRSGFPANKVCFEVTESIAINNLDNASRFMRKLKETGCQFSLDDFGTGTSSYSYLKSLPIDYLKIDGAFVKDIATNTHDYAVVKSINEIGHAMGKKTVAEYVENEFAYEALKQIGVDYVQGFGVEKPIPLFQLFG